MKANVAERPELRFPNFEGAWAVSSIDAIATFRRGSFPQPYGLKKWYDDENGFPFIQVFDVGSDLRLNEKTKRLISDAAKNLSVFVPKGSIVLTIQGSIGRIAVTQYDACCDRTLLIFTGFKTQIATMYFVYALYLRFEIEKQIAVGGTIKTITKEKLRVFPIPLPTLPEQEKIADFLTAVDKRIGQLTRKKALLEDYKKGVMQQLFSQAIRFKDDHGNDFPDWEEKKLKTVARIYDGTHSTPVYTKTGVPFYSVEHLTRGSFQKTKFISAEVFEKENKRVKLERGDVLMTRIGDIGTSRHLDWDVRASFYVSLALMKLQRERVSPEFAHQSIASRYFQRELWQRTIHVAFPKKINLGEIGECRITLPTLPEQTKIAGFLSAIDRRIEAVGTQITETQTFKRGLLQQMFV